MSDMTEYGTRNSESVGHPQHTGHSSGRLSTMSAGLATLVSVIALAFSGYSFYETVLKQADLRVYPPPLIYMYRQTYRDVFAIPVTISNDGAQRGTVLSFDLEIRHRETGKTMQFQNLHYGASPKGNLRLFTPVTIAGNNSFTDVILFHALDTGSFVGDKTGGVKLPPTLTLKLNLDTTGDWFSPRPPAPVTFDMTASFVSSFNDMESARWPTKLHDARWTEAEDKRQQAKELEKAQAAEQAKKAEDAASAAKPQAPPSSSNGNAGRHADPNLPPNSVPSPAQPPSAQPK